MIEEKRYLPVGCVGFQVCLDLLYPLSLVMYDILCDLLFVFVGQSVSTDKELNFTSRRCCCYRKHHPLLTF